MRAASELGRAIGGAMSVPVGAALGWLHERITGRRALVTVTIEALGDAGARAAFLHRFRRLGADPQVVGVILRIDAAPGSWAACQDLRTAILDVRAAGTAVHAILETPGNAGIYLASACDRIAIVPTGEVNLVGIAAELVFAGAALERLGIEPDFEAAGEYKAFGEPFTRSFASPANQEATGALVRDLHAQLLAGIAEGRRMTLPALEALLERAPIAPQDALASGLVDAVEYADESETWILEHHGEGAHLASWRGWSPRDAACERVEAWGDDGPCVVVLHLDGAIVMDDQAGATTLRARRIVPVLEKLRKDDDVAAVVLHVNSPGGSALASDLMWREVDLLARKKPVVAVYEDVSASGGVYLAAPATEIVARPGTLTGSIGVFGGKLVLGRALRKVGVNLQEISAAPNATLFSPARPFTDDQRERFRASLQRFYDGFVERVAAGRHRPVEEIEPYCRGRVWTGAAARRIGLVDAEGDLRTGIERARSLANLTDYRLIHWSSRSQGRLARMVSGIVRRFVPFGALARLVGGTSERLELLARHPGEAMALLPWELTNEPCE